MKRIMRKNFSPAGGLLAGCGAVMLAALGLIIANSTSNGGFLLLVLLCPLMHIFMHRHLFCGSGHHGEGDVQQPRHAGNQR